MKTKNVLAKDVEKGDPVVIYTKRFMEPVEVEVSEVVSKMYGNYTGNYYFKFANGHMSEDILPLQDMEVVIDG